MRKQRLGEILVEQTPLSADQVDDAVTQGKEAGQRLGEVLVGRKLLTSDQLAEALAFQCNFPLASTLPVPEQHDLLQKIPIGYARSQVMLPLELDEQTLKIAVADPLAIDLFNDLAVLFQRRLECVVAAPETIHEAINRTYEKQLPHAGDSIAELDDGTPDALKVQLENGDLLDSNDDAPIIRFVNSMLTQASQRRASDIHLEPFEKEMVVRFRIDGILYDILHPPRKAHAGIVSRIKVMADLDIAEKRLPQDGRFRVRIAGRDVDVRASTLPTVFGERVVLRLLETTSGVLRLEQVGLDQGLLPKVKALTDRPHGIFLVTGPTGSGKTTTLYAALSRLNTQEKNIITVEDPVEYQLDGVGQIQVNPKIDLTFANGLRSILRQDPDIIMVGEIRDAETAEIAVQAALTGHLVFSTLHTNDAAGALTRLVEMGVAPFLAASAIIGILAQRLVRKLCPDCREAYAVDKNLLEELGLSKKVEPGSTFYRPVGCDACQQLGYRGRTGLFELLIPDDRTRALVLENQDAAVIERAAVERGMLTLLSSGLSKALSGETSLEEVVRVTREEA
ncbi:MAG: type II secretion system protein GspE [Desulfuromonas sp.]|nr:MAG: type II secretion system protein GspE [Desulfuromonas sp.]